MKMRVRLHRRSYTKPIPPGATIRKQRGQGKGKVATWSKMKADGTSEVFTAPLTGKGDRIKVWSKHWFLTFTDGREVEHTIKATDGEESSKVARDKLHALLDHRAAGKACPTIEQWFDSPERAGLRAELVRVGVLEGGQNDQDQDPGLELDDLICEFERYLTDERERSEKYAVGKVNAIRRVFGDCGFRLWSDIDADAVKQWLLADRAGGNGSSKRTSNGHVQAVKQFTAYVVNERELADVDPLCKLRYIPKQATDKRHPRRILTPAELQKVIDAGRTGPLVRGISGPDRAILFWFMSATGLRCGECGSLTVSNLQLSGLAPCVKLDAKYTKNGKDAQLPLSRELADALKAHVATKLPTARLFTFTPGHLCQAWRVDLEKAGIAYVDDSGEYADVHSLRHYYGTRLAESGLSVHEVQRLMRHANIATTQRYFHASDERMRQAVESLPKLSIKSA